MQVRVKWIASHSPPAIRLVRSGIKRVRRASPETVPVPLGPSVSAARFVAMSAKSRQAAIAPDRWTKSEKGGMTHQLNRDAERKKRGGRTVRRAAPARPGREEHGAGRVDKFLAA